MINDLVCTDPLQGICAQVPLAFKRRTVHNHIPLGSRVPVEAQGSDCSVAWRICDTSLLDLVSYVQKEFGLLLWLVYL
jgi:hypothetical protein